MIELSSLVPPQRPGLTPDEVAAVNAARQGLKPSSRTVVQDGNRKVTITTDKNGVVHIAREGAATPVVAGVPAPVAGPTWTTTTPPWDGRAYVPSGVVDIAMGFFTMCAVMVVGWPLARAFGRRIERRGDAETAAIIGAQGEQLRRIEQGMEAMAIEVERISESQRFLTRLHSEGADRVAIGGKH